MKDLQLELLLSDKACRIIDNFAYLMNLQVVFYSIDGKVVKRGRNENNCEYCKYMQKQIFSVDDCLKLDIQKQKECREKQTTLVYQCHAGLTEAVTPIELYNNVVGYVIIGQFRMHRNPPTFLKSDSLQKLFMAQKHISFEELDHILAMFKTLLEYITEKELISIPSDYRLHKLNSYIENNLFNNISIAKAARFMNCSTSALSHYLQKEHNTTFKKIVINKKLRYAEKLMKNSPDLTISEIADKSGIPDSHYFSRIYRKYRGITPSQFKSE